jgi:hypothetical protein
MFLVYTLLIKNTYYIFIKSGIYSNCKSSINKLKSKYMKRTPVIEELTIESGIKSQKTRLYRAVTNKGISSEYDDVVVLAPGWLGSGTLHFAATHLAQQGHDVAVVSHYKTSLRHPNKQRSRNVHLTAKAASRATGKSGVILAGHSLGNRDVHTAAEAALIRQIQNPDDPKLYRINAIAAMAGVGLNGKLVDGRKLYNEVIYAAEEIQHHPIEEFDVVRRSISNFLRKPALSVVEGFTAITTDVRSSAGNYIKQMVPRAYVESYLSHDGIILKPDNRGGFDEYEGTHLGPVIDGDIISNIIQKANEDFINPSVLEIAQFHTAA